MNPNNLATDPNQSSNYSSNAQTNSNRLGYVPPQQTIPQTLRVNSLQNMEQQFNNGHVEANPPRDYTVEEVYADEPNAHGRVQQSAAPRNRVRI
jgi:hypothetical protein